ncbi:MAG TPA: sigma-70 family RNA polymerase sigma factor [Candidatus Paceibacterota bacterium]
MADSKHIHNLVDRAREGDESAFGILYEEYFAPIYRFVYFQVRHKETAEDLTQSVFLKAMEAVPSYEDKGVPFVAWLYRIARNAVIDHWKKKREVLVESPEITFEGILDLEPRPDEKMGQKIRGDYVRELLLDLSEDQREIVILCFVEELSYAETSKITGKSEEAIRALKHRALKALRAKFDDSYL